MGQVWRSRAQELLKVRKERHEEGVGGMKEGVRFDGREVVGIREDLHVTEILPG